MRAVVAVTLGALAVLLAILQIGGAIAANRKGRNYSFVPFIGAILGVSACLIAPWTRSAWAIPIFLAIDPTPLLYAVFGLSAFFRK